MFYTVKLAGNQFPAIDFRQRRNNSVAQPRLARTAPRTHLRTAASSRSSRNTRAPTHKSHYTLEPRRRLAHTLHSSHNLRLAAVARSSRSPSHPSTFRRTTTLSHHSSRTLVTPHTHSHYPLARTDSRPTPNLLAPTAQNLVEGDEGRRRERRS